VPEAPDRCDDRRVTVDSTPATGVATTDASARPPLVRPRSGRMLAGVAAGTAAHLRADPLVVRVALVALAVTGIGVVVYGLLWLFMPISDAEVPAAPAVDRPSRRQTIGLVLLGIGALALVTNLASWGSGDVTVPLLLVGVGLATIWRQLDTDRTLARTARIRSEERAALAAHLHDSVLQTLALIQRHAGDQQAVARLARSQERELRTWLYEPAKASEGTWAGLVSAMVAEVEADHELTVDPVVVGDAPVDDALAALGAATRETLVNAAKHSGAASADLYTEVTAQSVSVFVRDRGQGFDPAAVPGDRRGLRDSVAGRLTRFGGTTAVRSAPGEGTEVELLLPREESA
jgi:signal transduction histidine kinase